MYIIDAVFFLQVAEETAGVDLQSMTSDINLYMDPATCLDSRFAL